MKKLTAIMLALALVLLLCGCSGLQDLKNVELPPLPDVSQTTPEATLAPTIEIDTSASTAESTLPQHVIVSMESHSEEHYDPQNGEKLILTFAYETPRVYIEGRDAAMNAINEYIAMVDETYYTGNDYGVDNVLDGSISGVNAFLEAATDNYAFAVDTGDETLPLEFACERTARVERIDSRVLSTVYNTYTYTGGAHGNYAELAYNFDTESGERITLDALSADPDALTAFLQEYITKLYTEDADGYYSARVYEDLAVDAENNPIADLVRDGAWYFNGKGMVFASQPYELGPYASGIIEFAVPYADLAGVIFDKYLPLEHDAAPGALEVKAQSDVADGSIEIIDKVTVDVPGEALCVQAVGTVYDIRLCEVDYTNAFYETARLWAASYMSDCVLQLETLIPDGMPKLMISYRTSDGAETQLLLTQSGEDGAYILMDINDIEAVG